METVVVSVAEGCKRDFLGGGCKKGGEKHGRRNGGGGGDKKGKDSRGSGSRLNGNVGGENNQGSVVESVG